MIDDFAKAYGVARARSIARALGPVVAVVRGEKSHVWALASILVGVDGYFFARRRRDFPFVLVRAAAPGAFIKIGRASCRERV